MAFFFFFLFFRYLGDRPFISSFRMHFFSLLRLCYTSTTLIIEFPTLAQGVVLNNNLFFDAGDDDSQYFFSSPSLDTADFTTSDWIGENENVVPDSPIDTDFALGSLDAGIGEENGLFDTDGVLLAGGGGSSSSSCSYSGGVDKRDGSGQAQCPTTSNNQLRIPSLPSLDDVENSIGSGDSSKNEQQQPNPIDEVAPTDDPQSRRKCSPDHPYHLCCYCDMRFAWQFCWACVASKLTSSSPGLAPIDFSPFNLQSLRAPTSDRS